MTITTLISKLNEVLATDGDMYVFLADGKGGINPKEPRVKVTALPFTRAVLVIESES